VQVVSNQSLIFKARLTACFKFYLSDALIAGIYQYSWSPLFPGWHRRELKKRKIFLLHFKIKNISYNPALAGNKKYSQVYLEEKR